MKDLTLEEFSSSWSDKPFILTQPVREWPIYGEWTTESLLASYADVEFRAEAVDWPLESYVQYMRNSEDESPLYLFDRGFVEKMDLKVGKGVPSTSYWAPECFGEDLFALLGDQRPDSRWLIMGPARSGSTFHKDPNATSAWNAVLTGSKYWLMFPSGPGIPTPPGIILSEDASEITSPLSIAEYLMSFHEMARSAPGCLEGICLAGEVLHVPSGWFHLVLNLEDSIAITQNFVPRRKLCDVLSFLRGCPDQISGFKDDVQDAYALFVTRLDQSHPQLLKDALTELEQRSKPRKTKWDRLTTSSENQEGGKDDCFSFGFGGTCDDYDDY
jgi:Cupin-like domain